MFNKSILSVLVSVGLVASASSALACSSFGDSMRGRIADVQTGSVYQGDVVFRFEPGASGSSISTTNWDYRFNAQSPEGKITYAALLTAYSTGRDVLARGCGSYIRNTEELRWLRME